MFDKILTEAYMLPLVNTIIGVHGGMASPNVPQINALFANPIFRFAFIALMVWLNTGRKDVYIALFVPAAMFVVTYLLKGNVI